MWKWYVRRKGMTKREAMACGIGIYEYIRMRRGDMPEEEMSQKNEIASSILLIANWKLNLTCIYARITSCIDDLSINICKEHHT